MMRVFTSTVAFLLLTQVFGQGLPRGLTEAERQIIAEGFTHHALTIPGELVSSTPPNDPRSMAEWEEQQAIVITWRGFNTILSEIVRYAKEEVTVLIVTTNPDGVSSYLENSGIDISENVEFIDAASNTIWVRDYGGNPVYVRDVDSLAFVDWIYNRPRPSDDVIPYAVAEHLNVAIHGTVDAPQDLVNTGGNYMSDGMGRGFASNLVLTENSASGIFGFSDHDEPAIDQIMLQYMGIEEYVKMTVLPFDEIHHIDMHMKLLDESTLLVGQYPEGIADGPQIEANLMYVVDQFKQRSGRDYNVVRIPMPPDQMGRYPHTGGHYRTYANAVFINKTILVPIYEERYDTTALRIWKETMPGYRIIGIDCNAIIPQSGAIHCITKEVGVHRPLWITHLQPGEISAKDPIILEAGAKHLSGVADVWAFYRVEGAVEYDSVQMTAFSGDNWSCTLPDLGSDLTIEYYFRAEANDGKIRFRPLPAPEAFFRVRIGMESTGTSSEGGEPFNFRIFPNPANAITCVSITHENSAHGSVEVWDLYGRLVKTLFEGTIPAGESRYFLNAAILPSGIYVVKVFTMDREESLLLSVN